MTKKVRAAEVAFDETCTQGLPDMVVAPHAGNESTLPTPGCPDCSANMGLMDGMWICPDCEFRSQS